MSKLAFLGKNLANIVYLHAKAIRCQGIPVDIFIGYENFGETCESAKWVHKSDKPLSFFQKTNLLLKVAKNYKYIQCYSGTSPYLQFFHNNFVVYASSHNITLEFLKNHPFFSGLMKRSLLRAKAIIYSDYAHVHVFRKWYLEDKSFSIRQPFFLSDWKVNLNKKRKFFFMPSRLDILEKNNEVVFKAYEIYRKKGGKIPLISVLWGEDSKYFFKKYHSSKGIRFIEPINSKKILNNLYSEALLVFDRFNNDKILGLVPIEAWASGATVVSWIEEKWYTKQYGKKPPIYNTSSPWEIAEIMLNVENNPKKFLFSPKILVDFVKKHHNPAKIAKKMISIYSDLGWEID